VTSSDDDLDALSQRASGRKANTGEAQRKRPPSAKPAKSNAPMESLDELVSGMSKGRSAPAGRATTQSTVNAPGPVESLEQLLPARSAETPKAKSSRHTSATTPSAPQSLETLIYSTASAEDQRARQPQVKEQVVKKPLDLPIEDLVHRQSAAAELRKPAGFRLPLQGIVLITLLVMCIGFAIFQHQSGKVSYPSPLAAQVAQLASAVDAYYEKHRSLPQTLGELEMFPKDAVEWPIENYGVQLLEQRTEYFFSGSSSDDYLIIGRDGEEAWAFAKSQTPELLKVPAR
jgi:hypothetical protein